MANDLFGFCRRSGAFRPLSGLGFLGLDLRYSSDRNICGRNLYLGEREAWLRREAVDALGRGAMALQEGVADMKFRLYDATRPVSVQRQLFAAVAGTLQQAYVADPDHGSVHNYGLAVDVGLQDGDGRELDLGTPFDAFDPLAQPQLEQTFLKQGKLNASQLKLRVLLRSSMAGGGFAQNPMEWWHFELRSMGQVRGVYPVVLGD